ncbi:MAG: pantoate--beta-alanine ligase [Planctomycetota bacterium]
MPVVNSVRDIKRMIKDFRNDLLTVGFVPTMGALHEGHLSLARQAKRENDKVVVSIFVNPLQFGRNEDFSKYPRTLERDCELLSGVGADMVFQPEPSEMYPPGFCTTVAVERLEERLCGKSRPGHFRGVAVVVLKLLHLVSPDIAYFGQKDFQQTVIIKRMVSDLSVDVTIKVLPIVRDAGGLALSSRNAYLSETEKVDALCLYQSLAKAQSMVKDGVFDAKKIIKEMEKIVLTRSSASIDYISIVHPETLVDAPEARSGNVVAVAVRIGKTRLIDNVILS